MHVGQEVERGNGQKVKTQHHSKMLPKVFAGSHVAKKEASVAPQTSSSPLSISATLNPLLSPTVQQGPSEVPPQGLCTCCCCCLENALQVICKPSCFSSFRSQLNLTSS